MLLVDDARLSMPPLPAWFDGVESVRGFLVRMFQTPWRLEVTAANAQPALVCWQDSDDDVTYHLGGLTVLTLRGGQIAVLTCLLAPLVEDNSCRPTSTHDQAASRHGGPDVCTSLKRRCRSPRE